MSSQFIQTQFTVQTVGTIAARAGIDTVATFTPPNLASIAFICVEGQAARLTFDGTNPTATQGLRLPANLAPFRIDLAPNIAIKAIGEAAGGFLTILWARAF
ncbi:hypothetical protein [Chroococcidiopsis sp. CCMEE 29]|uniref:hypothetical protein n=1 Tax=Chroococcidiopsis sp. CCMEE 29 TaxID=155894 RepID=UPI002020064D|nr:hypothetical protein [Chroococcidiopsis sp. CCMEE 29]